MLFEFMAAAFVVTMINMQGQTWNHN